MEKEVDELVILPYANNFPRAHLKVHFVAIFVVGLVLHLHELAPYPTRNARSTGDIKVS